MKLFSHGNIFAGLPNTPTANSCFPSIVRLGDGTLLASWRVGSQKDSADGQILLARSTDDGQSWSEPEKFPAGPWTAKPGEVHYAPLTVLGGDHLLAAMMWVDRSDAALPFFNPVTEGLLPLRTWFCESRDGGRTWGDYRAIGCNGSGAAAAELEPFCVEKSRGQGASWNCGEAAAELKPFCVEKSRGQGASWNSGEAAADLKPFPFSPPPPDHPLAITGPVLVLGDGRLACQFEVNKPYDDTQPWRHAAAWKVSSDDGRTWPHYVNVAHDPGGRLMYWDAHYAFDGRGGALAAFWTYDRQQQRDRNIHLSESHDGGQTWTIPRDCGLAGQVGHPILLDGERLLLIYVDRFHTRSIRAAISHDRGRSFAEDMVVYQHPAAQAERGAQSTSTDYLQDMELWTFGRVDATVGPGGSVWIIYYAGDARSTDIRWARLEVSNLPQSAGLHTHLAEHDGRH
jgi:hypothetical protein